MVRALIYIVLPLILLSACASNGPAKKECFHFNASIENAIGYCQAVRIGSTLHISGSVGQGEMPAAIRMAYAELKQTLEAHGLGFQNVVKENVYTTDLDSFIANKDIRKEYYGSDFSAATWVQVSRLYRPAYVVEVEITAEFPN